MTEEVSILMKDSDGEKIPGKVSSVVGKFINVGNNLTHVYRGELLVACRGKTGKVNQKEGHPAPNFLVKKDQNIMLYCSEDDVSPLTDPREVKLLEGIESCAARHALFVGGVRLEWALDLGVDQEVYVQIPSANLSYQVSARAAIRYIGEVTNLPGYQFGVEILDGSCHGLGTTDGSFKDHRYFACKDGDGLFVSLEKISQKPIPVGAQLSAKLSSTTARSYASATAAGSTKHDTPAGNTRSKTRAPSSDSTPRGNRSKESSADPPKPYQFRMDERVMVYNKQGKKVYGKVRWCGERTKTRELGFIAVGIETELEIFLNDFEGCINGVTVHGVPARHWVVMPETMVTSTEREPPPRKPDEPLIDLNNSVSLANKFGVTKHELMAEQEEVLEKARQRVKENDASRRSQQGVPSMARESSVNQSQPPQKPAHIYDSVESLIIDGSTGLGQSRSDGRKFNQDHDRLHADHHHQLSIPTTDSPKHLRSNPLPGVPSSAVGQSHGTHPTGQHESNMDYVNLQALSEGNQHHLDQHHNQGYYRGQHNQQYPHDQNQFGHVSSQQPSSQNLRQNSAQGYPRGNDWHGDTRNPNNITPTSYCSQQPQPRATVGNTNHYNLTIGSPVQIASTDRSQPPRYGVIRWIGEIARAEGRIAGIELDDYLQGCTDGTFKATGEQFFYCPFGRGLYFPLASLLPDWRLGAAGSNVNCTPTIPGNPIQAEMEELVDQYIHSTTEQMMRYIGDRKGIQGHQNSCYLDSTIFGLFALNDVFDTMFLEPGQAITSDQNRKHVAELLWKGIVNPLRKNGVVRYESVMRMRNALDELGKMEGIKEKEKDPEEFLNMLFKHVLHTKPFISIRRPFGVEKEFFVQLFVEADPNLRLPTVGALLSKMFKEQQISFVKVPFKLLLQVPRFGREFKTYQRIIPELKINIRELTDNSKNSPPCFVCGERSTLKCENSGCISNQQFTYYCQRCSNLFHQNPKERERANHVLTEAIEDVENVEDVGLTELDLLSVICIETSHYVCFTRDPKDDYRKKWIFFDSMADRQYDTYNIPRVTDCTAELNYWVYEGDRERLVTTPPRQLPELVRRFTQDIYLCVYIQPELAMYGNESDDDDEQHYIKSRETHQRIK